MKSDIDSETVTYRRRGFDIAIYPGMERELALLSHEVFDKNPYTRHGIVVSDGDCIVDVGANLGLFALWCTTQAARLRVYACEPMPPLANLAQTNLAAIQGHQVRFKEVGVGAEASTLDMTYYPRATACSTAHGLQTEERMPGLYSGTEVTLRDLWGIHKGAFLLGLACGPFFGSLRRWVIKTGLRWALSKKEIFACSCLPLSALFREWDIDQVDLLKLDIQGAEVDALAGIDEEDWSKIKSIAMEVNSFLGRSETVDLRTVLEERGYHVVRDDDPDISAPGSYFLYARRLE